VGVSVDGMATVEGPRLSLRPVNALGHFTNWIVGHVHAGALGWNGMIGFGMLYWLAPKLWGKVHNQGWVSAHFWMSTIGIVLYIVSMWAAGITEGLMWRALGPDGLLQYPNFVDIVKQLEPFYWVRFLGGTLYLSGAILMMVNFILTVRDAKAAQAAGQNPIAAK